MSNDSIVLEGIVPAPARPPTARSSSPKPMPRARSSTCCRSARRSRSCSKSASPKSSAARSSRSASALLRRQRRQWLPGRDRRRRQPDARSTTDDPGPGSRPRRRSSTASAIIDQQTFARRSALNFDADARRARAQGRDHDAGRADLVALSGETASFLAGGEFPVPVAQSGSGGGGNSIAITVEFKPFGVSLAFTPTVLADGVINMVVAPEVSSIDPTASIVINNLRIPGLQTRRAKTDGRTARRRELRAWPA